MTVPAYVNAYVDSNTLVLLRRDDDGVLKYERRAADWVTYFRLEDLTPDWRRVLRNSEHVKALGFEHLDAPGAKATKGWVRVSWRDREARYNALSDESPLRKSGIKIYEGDVHPVRRFFSDTGANIQAPRAVFLDIETDSRVPFSRKEEMRILCWTLVDINGDEVARGVLERDTDADEARILAEMWNALDPFDQVIAYASVNGDTFDFEVIFARTEKRGLRVDARRWLWLDLLTVYDKMNNATSGDEKTSLKLNSVAHALLGEGKHDFDARFTWREWEKGGEARQRLVEYCLQDTRLLPKIAKKTNFLALFQAVCNVARVFPETRGLGSTMQVDGFMLRLAVERGHHFDTRYRVESLEKRDKYAGAYVKHPEFDGIAEHVHVADFTAMYPSIMITWNMSPETIAGIHTPGDPIPAGLCLCPLTNVLFRTDVEGMIPAALKMLIALRVEWNDRKSKCIPNTPEFEEADLASTAYKVNANAVYGVAGSQTSRYYNVNLAQSVTQNGKWLIQATEAEAKKQLDAHVGFIDTDSTFCGVKPGKAFITEDRFREFVGWCNVEMYPRMVQSMGCTTNLIKIAYEKECKRIVFTAAKRYIAVWEHYKGKRATAASKPEIKGLEYRRGDQALLARQLQKSVIDLFCDHDRYLNADDYDAKVRAMKIHILQDELTLEEVSKVAGINRKTDSYAIRKKLDGTNAAQPPHVTVAKIMQERGEEVSEGTRIAYVVTDGSDGIKAIPASDFTGECDRFYLWESMVWPPSQRLLMAMFPNQAPRWKAHDRVRPTAPRRVKGWDNPDQIGLFGGGPPAPPQGVLRSTLAVPAMPRRPASSGA